ncbi:thiamine-phosphate kinase, partial [Tessaracoccus lubricantis]
GGEDHALAATFPPGTGLPDGWQRIGEVREGTGITVDGAAYEGAKGWDHFG